MVYFGYGSDLFLQSAGDSLTMPMPCLVGGKIHRRHIALGVCSLPLQPFHDNQPCLVERTIQIGRFLLRDSVEIVERDGDDNGDQVNPSGFRSECRRRL